MNQNHDELAEPAELTPSDYQWVSGGQSYGDALIEATEEFEHSKALM